jgi:hypothetical protein
MKALAIRLAMNRFVLITINCLLLFISLSVIREMFRYLGTESNDSADLESMAAGIAIMLYGYGVSLELRRSTLAIFGLTPRELDRREQGVSHTCRKYGILFVLLGLSLEILVQLINIPSRILLVATTEGALCSAGVSVLAATSLLLMRFSLRLATAPTTSPLPPGQSDESDR